MKLTKEMFEAGDICKQFKCNKKTKTKLIKQYALLQNDQESMIKRESTPLIDEQNNAVIVWSISDNVFPKVIKYFYFIIIMLTFIEFFKLIYS